MKIENGDGFQAQIVNITQKGRGLQFMVMGYWRNWRAILEFVRNIKENET